MLTREKRLTGIALVVAVAAALAIGYLGTPNRAPTPPVFVEKLSIALPTVPHAALLQIAAAKGFFADEGLDVTLVSASHGKAALELMVQGKADLATAAEVPFVIGAMKGETFGIAASVVNVSLGNAVLARRDRGIALPRDLTGKRVGVTFGTTSEYFLWMYLIRHRVPPDSVTLVDIPPARLQHDLVMGTIDAIATWQPLASNAERALGENAVSFSAPDVYAETHVVIGRSDFLRAHPQMIVKLVRALLEAERFARAQPEQALNLVAERLKVGVNVLQPTWKGFDFTVELPQTQLVIMEDVARWAMARGYVKKGPVPNFLPHLYLDALLAVRPERVTVVR